MFFFFAAPFGKNFLRVEGPRVQRFRGMRLNPQNLALHRREVDRYCRWEAVHEIRGDRAGLVNMGGLRLSIDVNAKCRDPRHAQRTAHVEAKRLAKFVQAWNDQVVLHIHRFEDEALKQMILSSLPARLLDLKV